MKNYLPRTIEYIESVFEDISRERGGHHNYVAKNHVLNLPKSLAEQSYSELRCTDNELLLKLKKLDEPHHNTGHRNAAKPDSEKATATIQMRCHPDDKALIVRNLNHGETIASFIMGVAVEEASKRESRNS